MSVTVARSKGRPPAPISSDTTSYLLVREAGGLGDDIRIGGVARTIKANQPNSRVTVLGLNHFHDVYQHLEGIDEFKPVDINLKYRRGRGETIAQARYLAPLVTGYDHVVDLFCPAYNYEIQEVEQVRYERTDMFVKEAGFPINKALPPKWVISPVERQEASTWLGSGIDPYRPLVGVHRRSTDASRSYRDEMSMELIHRLYDAGMNVILFDVTRGLGNNPAIPAIRLDLSLVAAIIEKLDVLVAVDSGLLHLAGALDVPIVGLFGSTDGQVIGKHYDCTVVEPYGFRGEIPSPCGNPCYYRVQRGWSVKCRDGGCLWLNLVYPPQIVDTVLGVLERKKEASKCVRSTERV